MNHKPSRNRFVVPRDPTRASEATLAAVEEQLELLVLEPLPLPEGASSEAGQELTNVYLESVDRTLRAVKAQTDQFAFTTGALNVNAAAPIGGALEATQVLQATAALQVAGNASLAAIEAKTPALVVDSLGVARQPVDLEASDYDIGGLHVINVVDRQQRRMHEQDQLAQYVAAMQSMIACEWESSHRMGFEVR